MKTKLFPAILLTLFVFTGLAFGAGVNTPVKDGSPSYIQDYAAPDGRILRKVRWANCTSNAGGDASGGHLRNQSGIIRSVQVVPLLTSRPTDSFDLQIYTDNDLDILCGDGADFDYSRASENIRNVVDDKAGDRVTFLGETIRVKLSNMGASKITDVYLIYELLDPSN